MALTSREMAGNGTFPHGIHPPERKNFSADASIEVLPTPEEVVIPLLQHLGAPCAPVVKSKQVVSTGEMVGQGKGFVTAPVHASINGKVRKGGAVTLPNGRHVKTVTIKAEGDQLSGEALFDEIYGGSWETKDADTLSTDDISNAISSAGIVGLGGAAFPTHVKLAVNEDKPIDTLVINGCECEPYLTTDYRLMLEAPQVIIAGAVLAARALGAGTVMVGVEDNKPKAIEALREAAAGTPVNVVSVKTKYPQGSEKQLIKATLNRRP